MYKNIHSISMLATPIPKSLDLISQCKNIEIYYILELPKGRQKAKTEVTTDTEEAYAHIIWEVKKGHQDYIISPLIYEEKIEAKKVIDTRFGFENNFIFYMIYFLYYYLCLLLFIEFTSQIQLRNSTIFYKYQ